MYNLIKMVFFSPQRLAKMPGLGYFPCTRLYCSIECSNWQQTEYTILFHNTGVLCSFKPLLTWQSSSLSNIADVCTFLPVVNDVLPVYGILSCIFSRSVQRKIAKGKTDKKLASAEFEWMDELTSALYLSWISQILSLNSCRSILNMNKKKLKKWMGQSAFFDEQEAVTQRFCIGTVRKVPQ